MEVLYILVLKYFTALFETASIKSAVFLTRAGQSKRKLTLGISNPRNLSSVGYFSFLKFCVVM